MRDFIAFYTFCSIVGVIGTVVSTIACPIIADRKGRSVGGWIVGGLLLGWLGLIIIACLEDLKVYSSHRPNTHNSYSSYSQSVSSASSSSHRWLCPKCKQMISDYPCVFCGYTNDSTNSNSKL